MPSPKVSSRLSPPRPPPPEIVIGKPPREVGAQSFASFDLPVDNGVKRLEAVVMKPDYFGQHGVGAMQILV